MGTGRTEGNQPEVVDSSHTDDSKRKRLRAVRGADSGGAAQRVRRWLDNPWAVALLGGLLVGLLVGATLNSCQKAEERGRENDEIAAAIQRGADLADAGRPREAVALLEGLVVRLTPDGERELYVWAEFNLGHSLLLLAVSEPEPERIVRSAIVPLEDAAEAADVEGLETPRLLALSRQASRTHQ